MSTIIKKWGNSLAVRLPKEIARKKVLREGTRVEVLESKEGVVIKPIARSGKSLKELVAMIRPENLHEEIEWGKSQGREVW